MVTESRLKQLRDIDGLNTISALTHREIVGLLQKRVIQADQAERFDERKVVEAHDPEAPAQRYCMHRRLQPLFAQDGQGKNRRWTFGNVVERLRQICSNTVRMGSVEFEQTTQSDEEQQRILQLLQVSM